MKNKNTDREPCIELSIKSHPTNPESVEEMLNSYGTYNIQPTSDTENDFPSIAQGLPSKNNRSK